MRGMGPGFMLGDASTVPVPGDEEESSPRKKREVSKNLGPNKAARASEHSPGLSLTYHDMQQLLAQQAETILQANRAHAQGLLDALEKKHGGRLDKLESGADKLAGGLQGVEERLSALERDLRQGVFVKGDGNEERRKTTLVFGGWERDTKKETILKELRQALDGLDLYGKVSEDPFTTGPRKNIALMNCPLLDSESDADRRRRMHTIVTTISQAKLMTSAGRKLWCAYSKTRQQRDVSGHCSWVKRALARADERLVALLDVEYATGSVWLGESLVASAVKTPNDGAKSHLMVTGRGAPPAWVDLEKLAFESKLSESDLREALEGTRR